MRKPYLVIIGLVIALWFIAGVRPAIAGCNGTYKCALYDDLGFCDTTREVGSPESCGPQGSYGACLAEPGSECDGGCVYNDLCSWDCGISACGGNNCAADRRYYNLGSTGYSGPICDVPASACYGSASCPTPTLPPGTTPTATPPPGTTPTPTPAVPTAPTNLACSVRLVQTDGNNSFTGTWTHGDGGSRQLIRMDDNVIHNNEITAVNTGCGSQGDGTNVDDIGAAAANCIEKKSNLVTSQESYLFPSGLRSGDSYFWRIVNINSNNVWRDATAVCRTCPVKTSPAGGSCSDIGATEFTADWTPSQPGTGGFTKQVIRVDQNFDDVDDGCPNGGDVDPVDTDPDGYCAYMADLTTDADADLVTGLTPGRTYFVRVAGVNDSGPACYKDLVWQCNTTAATPTPTPTPVLTIVSGMVYNGLGGGLNKCTGLEGEVDPDVIAGSRVRVDDDGQEGPVQGNGFYQVPFVTNQDGKIITLSGIDPEWNCNCPGGCQYSGAAIDTLGPADWNFYISNVVAAWAQVIGGHVHGQAGATVKIPTGNNFLIPASFTNNKSGVGSNKTGSFNTAPGGLSPDWSLLTDGIDLSTWRYSYQRLWIRAGSPTTDPDSVVPPGDPPPPGIYRRDGDYSTSYSGWEDLTGERVIFVKGNVNLRSNITLADNNSFLAIIASGDINVDPGVGDGAVANPTSANADLAGAFLANGNFSAGTTLSQTDKQLVIYGTVGADIDMNGAGRVRFQRDMGINNAVGPGVAVIWNPNLLLNFPDQLKDAVTDWREVAP